VLRLLPLSPAWWGVQICNTVSRKKKKKKKHSSEARIFFLNEIYPRFPEMWDKLAPSVQGWQTLHNSVRRTILSLASSFIAGVTMFAPRPANSSPQLRSSRLGAPQK